MQRMCRPRRRPPPKNFCYQVSYGLDDADDLFMRTWNGTILGCGWLIAARPYCPGERLYSSAPVLQQTPHPPTRPPGTVHENRIYSLRLFCDHSYPDRPPTVKFESRINLGCVKCAPPRPAPAYFYPCKAPRRCTHYGRAAAALQLPDLSA